MGKTERQNRFRLSPFWNVPIQMADLAVPDLAASMELFPFAR